jgi:predicted secreted protein
MADTSVSGRLGRVLFGTAAVNIASATYDTGVVTINFSAVHGLVQYDLAYIEGVVGMTDINGTWRVATRPDTDTITIIKTTSQTYTSGGTGIKTMDIIDLSLEINGEVIDTTSSSTVGNWKTFIPAGFSTATGTVNGLFIEGANLPEVQDEVSVIFRISDTQYYSGSGIITSLSNNGNVTSTDAVSVSIGIQTTGEVSFT